MATAIVFYSRSENTRYAAEQLAKKLDARIVELQEPGSRRGVFGFLKSGFQAATTGTAELVGEPWSDIGPYDTLFLLTPIWASNGTPAMNTFLANADLHGKRVTVVTFQADPALGGSDKVHNSIRQRVEDRGGSVDRCVALHSAPPGKFAGEEHLSAQLAKLS
jgi:hypothetical protein